MVLPRDGFVEWSARLGGEDFRTLDALRAVQAEHGAVRPADVRGIARTMRRPVAGVAGAASFYADLAGGPRGRRHIRVCTGTSCFAATGGTHVERLESLAERAPAGPGAMSVQRVHCLGLCYASPAALDGRTPRTGADLGGLLTADPGSWPPGPPPGSGPPIPFRGAAARSVILGGLTGAEGAWEVWPGAVAEHAAERVLTEVSLSGLRGRGGAGFPVAAKWSSAVRAPGPRYVVANGDEGDPGSFCDRLLMERDPHRVLEGLALAALAVGAGIGIVLVRSEYPGALARMRAAVAEAGAAGHLGHGVHGSGTDLRVEVVEGAGSYVAGEETALLRALAGLRGGVRPRPPYPTDRGLFGRPTAVGNVETLAAVPWIVRHGGAAYARLGHPEETGTKLVCLNEPFRRPGVYEVEFGTSVRSIVNDLGGGLRRGRTLRAVQIGGPLGGFLAPDELEVPLLAGALSRRGVALGHGSLVAIDAEIRAPALLRHVWSFAAAESCGACVPCGVGARRGLEIADGLGRGRSTVPARLHHLMEIMESGSLCAFGRGVPGAVRSLLHVFRDEFDRGRA